MKIGQKCPHCVCTMFTRDRTRKQVLIRAILPVSSLLLRREDFSEIPALLFLLTSPPHVFWCRTSTVCMFNLGTQILFLPERVTSVLYFGRNWRASLQLTLFLCLLLHDEETLDLWSWHHSLTLSPSPFVLEMELHNTGTYICVPYENAMSPGLAESFVLSLSYSPGSITSPRHGGEKTFGQAFKWTQQRSEEKNDVLTLLPPEWVPILVKYCQASPGQRRSQKQTLPLGLQTREVCDLWACWS